MSGQHCPLSRRALNTGRFVSIGGTPIAFAGTCSACGRPALRVMLAGTLDSKT